MWRLCCSDKMESIIKEITKDIEEFDISVAKHISKLNILRSDIIKDLDIKTEQLRICISENSRANSNKAELSGQLEKIRMEIETSNKNLEYIKTLKTDVESIEQNRDELRGQVDVISKEKEQLLSLLDIKKVEERQQVIKNESLISDEKEVNNNLSQLSDRMNIIKNEIVILENKSASIIATNKDTLIKTNAINSEFESEKIKLNDLKSTMLSIGDSIVNSKMKLSQLDSEILSKKSEILLYKSEIKELNETKDNITHVIANEKNKSRSDENKILAIKKEVLNLIMEYKDIGNKKRMSELTKELQDA